MHHVIAVVPARCLRVGGSRAQPVISLPGGKPRGCPHCQQPLTLEKDSKNFTKSKKSLQFLDNLNDSCGRITNMFVVFANWAKNGQLRSLHFKAGFKGLSPPGLANLAKLEGN